MTRRRQRVLSAREAALKALNRSLKDEAYLNLALPELTKNLSAKDRALATRLAQGTMERLNTLDWVINQFSHTKTSKMTYWVRHLLYLSAYQLLYLDRIPPYAAIDEAVELAHKFGHQKLAGFVNAVLRRLEREKEALKWPAASEDEVLYLSIRYSLPQWLVERALLRFGFAGAKTWAQAATIKPATCLRPNQLRTSTELLRQVLEEEGLSTRLSPLKTGMLRAEGSFSYGQSRAFKEGLFTVQGESSSLVAPLLEVKPGSRALDLCAAPGGKTTHLAELMQNEGEVIAIELNPSRLKLVEKAARRLGLDIIKPQTGDGKKVKTLGLGEPEAVLVDAPCSGLGVIGRLPEIKWRRKPADLGEFKAEQLLLLEAAASVLPARGRLVYSVCSTEPEETTEVVRLFNKKHPHFSEQPVAERLPEALQQKIIPGTPDLAHYIWPQLSALDGFFMALWQKK